MFQLHELRRSAVLDVCRHLRKNNNCPTYYKYAYRQRNPFLPGAHLLRRSRRFAVFAPVLQAPARYKRLQDRCDLQIAIGMTTINIGNEKFEHKHATIRHKNKITTKMQSDISELITAPTGV